MDFEKLDDIRMEKRYTVTALCDEVGIDQSTYYKLRANPSRMKLSTFQKIVKVLELSEEEQKEILT